MAECSPSDLDRFQQIERMMADGMRLSEYTDVLETCETVKPWFEELTDMVLNHQMPMPRSITVMDCYISVHFTGRTGGTLQLCKSARAFKHNPNGLNWTIHKPRRVGSYMLEIRLPQAMSVLQRHIDEPDDLAHE